MENIFKKIEEIISNAPKKNFNMDYCNIDELISLVEQYRDNGGERQIIYDFLVFKYKEAINNKWEGVEGCLDTLLECLEPYSGNPYKRIIF